jgi:hypothetical protein
MSPSDHEVIIDWTTPWNEINAQVVEVFGLPGNRFLYTPSADFMTFCFKSKKDAELCKIMLSEYI